ncbi:MAG: universal stress protein [Aeromicrobium sp.]
MIRIGSATNQPVLVGLLGHQPTVLRFALMSAQSHHSRLTVLHSTGMPPQPADFYAGFDVIDELRREGQSVLDDARRLIEQESREVPVEYVLTSEPALPALEQAAAGARLVVLGSDTLPPLDRLLRTAVSGHLALHAPCPVVVVPELSPPGVRGGDVVLALDGETPAEGPIRFALEEAEVRGTAVKVLHVAPEESEAADIDARRTGIAEILAGWREKYPDVPLAEVVEPNDPRAGVLHATRDATLVVVGRPHRRGLPGSRSVAGDVLRQAHGPVAVVPARW